MSLSHHTVSLTLSLLSLGLPPSLFSCCILVGFAKSGGKTWVTWLLQDLRQTSNELLRSQSGSADSVRGPGTLKHAPASRQAAAMTDSESAIAAAPRPTSLSSG
eukprot:616007-Rhodomonas_salina.1